MWLLQKTTLMQKQIKHLNSVVSYSIYGSGKTVVLLHGFGEDSTIWKNVVLTLQNDYQIITIDIAGTGASSFLEKENVGMEDYAELITTVINCEGLNNICLLGHSMGGYIALAFAEKHPEKLWGFGLVHSTALADTAEKIEARKKSIDFINENGTEAFLKATTPNLFYNQELGKDHIMAIINQNKNTAPKVLVQYYNAMINRPDRTQILKLLRIPLLFIVGKNDKAVPFESSLPQTFMAQNTYLSVLGYSAHMGMIEEACSFNSTIENYVAFAAIY
jgi:pimeloyl-ACP methyl ester carboxylesterase